MFEDADMDCFGLTDRGHVRKINQDQFLIGTMHKMLEIQQTSLPHHTRERLTSTAVAHLILVADGVGGGAAGEEASGLALEAVAYYVTSSLRCFYKFESDLDADLLSALESSVQNSHRMVQSAAASSPDFTGMATTLTVAHILWPRVYIVHVGDTRCYLMRQSVLSQLTRDQTLAQGLVDEGVMSPDTAERSPLSNVLSSAVGKEITPISSSVEVETGDLLMLCTDGLTKHLNEGQIHGYLSADASAEDMCRSLVNTALDGGGTDNITVVVCRFV